MIEKYPGCIMFVRRDYIEIELFLDDKRNRTIVIKVEPELVPIDLRNYGHPIWIIVEPDLEYTVTHRTFVITEEMQKENDEMKELVKKLH